MEIIPLDHLILILLGILFENIFCDNNIYSMVQTFILSLHLQNPRSADRKDWSTAGLYLQRCIAPLGGEAPGHALHRKQAPCCGKSSCVISRRSLCLSLQVMVQRQEEGQYKLQISYTNFPTSLSLSSAFTLSLFTFCNRTVTNELLFLQNLQHYIAYNLRANVKIFL
jgi:hypothetical protein